MPQNPTRQVHALLAAIELEDSLTVKDLPANLTIFYNGLCFLPKPKRHNKPKRLLQKNEFCKSKPKTNQNADFGKPDFAKK
jgi:hypothetical protein